MIMLHDQSGFDKVVLATGVSPRKVDFPGHDHKKVVTYVQVLRREVRLHA